MCWCTRALSELLLEVLPRIKLSSRPPRYRQGPLLVTVDDICRVLRLFTCIWTTAGQVNLVVSPYKTCIGVLAPICQWRVLAWLFLAFMIWSRIRNRERVCDSGDMNIPLKHVIHLPVELTSQRVLTMWYIELLRWRIFLCRLCLSLTQNERTTWIIRVEEPPVCYSQDSRPNHTVPAVAPLGIKWAGHD